MPISESGDENAFTRILTTASDHMPREITRQQSWLTSVKRNSSLNGNDMTTCPSCRGTGLNERDPSTELVALIPYNDERLKPRRTKRKILAALLVCAVILGAGIYIFLPGKVNITTTNITIVEARIAEISYMRPGQVEPKGKSKITWQVNVTVENKNRFLPITIDTLDIALKVESTYELTQVGLQSFGNFSVASNANHSDSYTIPTPEHGPEHGTYSDTILNCKCCNQWTGEGELYMTVSLTLHYTLNFVGLKYFSSFISSEMCRADNCNYFQTIGVKSKNITCEIYNTCWNYTSFL